MFKPNPAPQAGRGRRAALPASALHCQSRAVSPRLDPQVRTTIAAGPGSAGKTVAMNALGVAMRCLEQNGGSIFQILLLNGSREADILFEAKHDQEIVAVWRRMAGQLALPAVILSPAGDILAFSATLGCLSVSDICPRRRNSLLAKRRPRALMRRRVGRLAPRPSIHREREITAPGD